jgi:hypothetical protein
MPMVSTSIPKNVPFVSISVYYYDTLYAMKDYWYFYKKSRPLLLC